MARHCNSRTQLSDVVAVTEEEAHFVVFGHTYPVLGHEFGDVAEGWQLSELLHASCLLQSETCNSGRFIRYDSF